MRGIPCDFGAATITTSSNHHLSSMTILVSRGIPPKSSAALAWPIRELRPPTSTIAPASFADATRLRRGFALERAICAQLGADDPQRLGMKDQREMPDVVQRHDPSERRAIGQPFDRRGHDRIVVAENSQLPRTPLTVR